MTFAGFPDAALDFYDDLEADNSKVFWEAHKDTYRTAVHAPMVALTEALAEEFGAAKIFRPYRDVRFAKDKTPYKTHQGAFVGTGEATGWYVEISAAGTKVAAGCYHADSELLGRLRTAIDQDITGKPLAKMFDTYRKAGWEVGGDTLKTAPRGFAKDHPRIELLRHKQFVISRDYGFEADAVGPGLLDRVRADWRSARTLIDWLTSPSLRPSNR
ncbi:DUF2461 domain-containing protein [Millisia brevis]|uniref:DUF2461 domain-containing protein n=1 Tax=Millisia brevis TaxID=264148 RepID=UPI000837270D|nr:DUF2461 domain-containing protein [Millisia brevis]